MAEAFPNDLMNSTGWSNTTGYMTATPDQYFFMNDSGMYGDFYYDVGSQLSYIQNYKVIMVRRVQISMSCYYH